MEDELHHGRSGNVLPLQLIAIKNLKGGGINSNKEMAEEVITGQQRHSFTCSVVCIPSDFHMSSFLTGVLSSKIKSCHFSWKLGANLEDILDYSILFPSSQKYMPSILRAS